MASSKTSEVAVCRAAEGGRLQPSVPAWARVAACGLLMMAAPLADAQQVQISGGGMPAIRIELPKPPVRELGPALALEYVGYGNGRVGHGWRLGGVSAISRCPSSKLIDGLSKPVQNSIVDRLCLDGQRLIRSSDAGVPLTDPGLPDMVPDAEFRLESDNSVRIRTYYKASSFVRGVNDGPNHGARYIRVWRSDGLVYDYGAPLVGSPPSSALVMTELPGLSSQVMHWPLFRVTDKAGNYVEYRYSVDSSRTGSIAAAYALDGYEWSLNSVHYGGNQTTGRLPTHTMVFGHIVKPVGSRARWEWIQAGAQLQSNQLLEYAALLNYEQTQLLAVARFKYDYGPVTAQPVLASVKICGAAGDSKCQPPTSFQYSLGTGEYVRSTEFTLDKVGQANGLAGLPLRSTDYSFGVLKADFNGDGYADLIRWANNPAENRLFLSEGQGRYREVTRGIGAGQFNITGDNLFKGSTDDQRIDLCYRSVVADFNGDGLSDILRVASATERDINSRYTCPAGLASLLFLSNGDGSFTKRPVTDADTLAPFRLGVDAGTASRVAIDRVGYSNFAVADIDGDGRADIFAVNAAQAVVLPAWADTQTRDRPGLYCYATSRWCEAIYWLSNGDGSFRRVTDVAWTSIRPDAAFASLRLSGGWVPFADPRFGELSFEDRNGDDVLDLLYPGYSLTAFNGIEITAADGSLSGVAIGGRHVITGASESLGGNASMSLDYNGDGRPDLARVVSAFDNVFLKAGGLGGREIAASFAATALSRPLPIDIDGDGRSDLLFLRSSGVGTTAYRSLGTGGFESMAVPLGFGSEPLIDGDGRSNYLLGGFGGPANDLLVLGSTAVGGVANKLFVKSQPLPADLLTKVTSPTGVVTDITYEMLPMSSRYASDRGSPEAATLPKMDLVPTLPVVTRLTVDAGVGTAKLVNEFGYRGAKLEVGGRGYLGFREMRQQIDSPDGTSKLTTVRKFFQQHPYIGSVAVSETYLGPLSPMNAPQTGQLLSRTENTYCDTYAAAGAENSATVSSPCPVSSKLNRPYLFKSVQTGWDLAGNALPSTTTTQRYSSGYLQSVLVQTQGSGPAGNESFSKQTTYEYFPDDISGDNWKVGKVKKVSSGSTVPNSLGSVSTGAGSAPKASSTSGQ